MQTVMFLKGIPLESDGKQQELSGCRLDNGAFEKEYLSIGNPSETNSKCVVSG